MVDSPINRQVNSIKRLIKEFASVILTSVNVLGYICKRVLYPSNLQCSLLSSKVKKKSYLNVFIFDDDDGDDDGDNNNDADLVIVKW